MNEKFENFDELVKYIKENNITFLVDLSLAREFLTYYNDKPTIIWMILIALTALISLIISVYSLGIIFGILYGIFIVFLQFSYLGICSINIECKKIIYYIAITVLIFSFCFNLKVFLLLAISSISLIFIYQFYEYILRKTVDVALKNEKIFNFFIDNNVLHFMNND